MASTHGGRAHNGPVGVTQDPNRIRFVPLWQLVEANLGRSSPEWKFWTAPVPFDSRAGLETGEEDDDEPDLMSTVETELARRRFAGPVRLEMDQNPALNFGPCCWMNSDCPKVRSWCEQVRSNRPPTTNWQIYPVLICNAKSGRPPFRAG